MNKILKIIAVILYIGVLSHFAFACERQHVGKTDSDREDVTWKYVDLFNSYCRKGLFDSLSVRAGDIFAARSQDMDERLVLVSGLYSAQAAIFTDDYPKAERYIDTLSGMEKSFRRYPDLQAMLNGIMASYDIKAGFDYPSALIHLTEALNYYRHSGDAVNTCTALFNISMIYFFRRDTTGLRYAREAIGISEDNPEDTYMMCTADVVMSMMLLVKGDYSNARKYAMEARKIADRDGYSLVYSRIFMVLGEVAMHDGNLSEAERLLREGFGYAQHSDPDFYFELSLTWGEMLIRSGRYDEAATFLANTLEMIDEHDNIRYRYQVLALLSRLYEATEDVPAAFRYYKMAAASRDSILNVDKEASFNNLLDLYEQASLQNAIRQRKFDMYVILSICVLTTVAGVFFFWLYRRQSRQNKELVQHYQDYMKRGEMLRKYLEPAKQKGSESADEELFNKLEKLMREEKIYLSNEISLDRLASMLGTNRTYISRVINRYADRTFWGYVNMYRIADATRLLSNLDNDIQIKNLYEILGYNSAASFFRVFRDEVGLSPSKYREEVRRLKPRHGQLQ